MKASLLLLLLVISVITVGETGPQRPNMIAHSTKGLSKHVTVDENGKLVIIANPRTAVPRDVLRMYGGLNPIGNIDDPLIQEIAEWAVSEHVKHTNYGLTFGKVVSGEEQIVAGMNYYLVIQTLNVRGRISTYKAQVYDCPWTNTRMLTSFVPAN